MITNLSIRNFILIEQLDLEFPDGFIIITGETGAGKSIILNAINFVTGQKTASNNLLRIGSQQGYVSIVFTDLPNEVVLLCQEFGIILEEGELILKRMLNEDGRSKIFINGESSSLQVLKQISKSLIEIYGQHEQRNLLELSKHRLILDQFGSELLGQEYDELLANSSNLYKSYNILHKEYSQKLALSQQTEKEIDYLSHVVKELKELNLQPGEEEELAERRSYLISVQKNLSAINAAINELESANITGAIAATERILLRQNERDFDNVMTHLNTASENVLLALQELESMQHRIAGGEDNIDDIEQRLFAIRGAIRKYNTGTADGLAEFLQSSAEQLYFLENSQEELSKTANALTKAKAEYQKIANILFKRRQEVASEMVQRVTLELAELKMPKVKFVINVAPLTEEHWHSGGMVEFMASTNPGQPALPIHKIASGGELSRLMLALRVLSDSENTIIFDEIDTGVSGAVSEAIGRRLHRLGEKTQLLVITHQAQVASHASQHLYVQKYISGDDTYVNIKWLNQEERKLEIARMLSGREVTKAAEEAAEDLLSSAGAS